MFLRIERKKMRPKIARAHCDGANGLASLRHVFGAWALDALTAHALRGR